MTLHRSVQRISSVSMASDLASTFPPFSPSLGPWCSSCASPYSRWYKYVGSHDYTVTIVHTAYESTYSWRLQIFDLTPLAIAPAFTVLALLYVIYILPALFFCSAIRFVIAFTASFALPEFMASFSATSSTKLRTVSSCSPSHRTLVSFPT